MGQNANMYNPPARIRNNQNDNTYNRGYRDNRYNQPYNNNRGRRDNYRQNNDERGSQFGRNQTIIISNRGHFQIIGGMQTNSETKDNQTLNMIIGSAEHIMLEFVMRDRQEQLMGDPDVKIAGS